MRVFHIQSTQQTGVGGDGLRPVILRIVVMGIAVFLAVTIVPASSPTASEQAWPLCSC